MAPEGKGFAGDREAQQPGVCMLLTYLKSGRASAGPQKTKSTQSSLDL